MILAASPEVNTPRTYSANGAERGHLSTADLNQILLEQRGRRIDLGELLLPSNKIAKIDLIFALAEVSDLPYLDCTRVQVDPEARS